MYANRIGYNSIQYTSVCNKPDIQYTSTGTYNTHSSVTVMVNPEYTQTSTWYTDNIHSVGVQILTTYDIQINVMSTEV